MPQIGETQTNPNDPSEVGTWNGQRWVIARTGAGGGRVPRGNGGGRAPSQAQMNMELRGVHADAAGATANLQNLNNFQELNNQQETGGLLAIPGASDVAAPFNSNIAGMRAITARMAPAARPPGSGSSSDRDVRMYERAGPRVENTRETNSRIIGDQRAEAIRRQTRAAFLDSWAEQHGSLTGAETAFEQFWGPAAAVLQSAQHLAAHPPGPPQHADRPGGQYDDDALRREFGG